MISETRAAPFHKATGADRLVCFCFGHRERDITDELHRRGVSTLRAAIVEACRAGRSDCEALNPEGRCCVGTVTSVLKGAASPPDSGADHG